MKLSMRADGRIEYICKHGCGHTVAIPYMMVSLVAKKAGLIPRVEEQNAHFSHGCDGCCGQGRKVDLE